MSATPQTIRTTIPISAILLSQTEPQIQRRKRFSKAEISELAESIKSNGLINPVLVRPSPFREVGEQSYELVAGERRYLAAKLVTDSIDATVRDLSDEQVIEIQLIENLQRVDVHPLQEAEGYEQLMKKHGHRVEDLGDKVGKSRGYVYARLKLLALCKDARDAFYDGKLTPSTALLVARIPVDSLQKEALKRIADAHDPMSARAAAEYVQREFMLSLGTAPFPTDIDNFVPGARKCGECPKNTISAPDLFGDVKAGSAGVCTDTTCFRAKCDRAIEVKIEQAKKAGQLVIVGEQAKKILPFGPASSAQAGYTKLDGEIYVEGRGYVKARTLIEKDTRTTLVKARDQYNDNRMELVEVVETKLLVKSKAKGHAASGRSASNVVRREPSKDHEKAFRCQVMKAVFERAPTKASRATLEHLVMNEFQYGDEIDQLFKLLGWKYPGYSSVEKYLRTMSDADLYRLAYVIPFAGEISGYGSSKQLLAAAAALKIDVKKVKKDLAAAAKQPPAAPAKASKKKARKAK